MQDIVWLLASCFGLTIVSALLPWVNAEIILFAFAAKATTKVALFAFVIVATTGQMVGKSVLFWSSRGTLGTGLRATRASEALDKLTAKLAGHEWRTHGFVFLSSVVGIPPFYLVTIAAGTLGVNFLLFCAFGSMGRLARFSAVALAGSALL
jgi:membrane protein YqaA with SNARE-associated domain